MLDPIELKPIGNSRLYQTIEIAQGARQQIVIRLLDQAGAPVDLVHEPDLGGGKATFDGQRPLSALGATVRLMARVSRQDPTIAIDITGKILQDDPSCKGCLGLVEFELTEATVPPPGLFWAEIGLFSQERYLVRSWPVLVQVNRSVFAQVNCATGPLTIPEVRYALNDVLGLEVSLLDDTEFTDDRILVAIERVISIWNETPPPVTIHTTESFPYRYYWNEAVQALLLRGAASSYRRNDLQYSAGGVAINDQAKWAQYDKAGAEKFAEFKEWMKMEKIRLNARRAYGRISV